MLQFILIVLVLASLSSRRARFWGGPFMGVPFMGRRRPFRRPPMGGFHRPPMGGFRGPMGGPHGRFSPCFPGRFAAGPFSLFLCTGIDSSF